MARHPNANWNLPDRCENWEQVNTAVLMDIRDELQELNKLLHCPNFLEIPMILRAIRRNVVQGPPGPQGPAGVSAAYKRKRKKS